MPPPAAFKTGGLDDTSVESFKDLFRHWCEEHPNDAVALKSVEEELVKSKSLSTAINVSNYSRHVSDKLDFLEALYDLTGGNAALTCTIAADKRLTTLRDVAIHYYGLSQSPVKLPAARWAVFRSQLFEKEPTAVLYGQILAGVIPVAENHK